MKTQIELTAEEYTILVEAVLAWSIVAHPGLRASAVQSVRDRLFESTRYCKPGQSAFTITIETKDDE